MTHWQQFAEIGDQFLLLYSQSTASSPAATLFAVGQAAELYLKAAACYLDPSKSGKSYGHGLSILLDLMHANGLLLSFEVKEHIRDSIMSRGLHPSDALSDPKYVEYIKNQELYWVAYYLADIKYLGSEHIRAPEHFNVLVMPRNPYWIPLFQELQTFLNWPSAGSFTDHIEFNIVNERVSADATSYLRLLRQKVA